MAAARVRGLIPTGKKDVTMYEVIAVVLLVERLMQAGKVQGKLKFKKIE